MGEIRTSHKVRDKRKKVLMYDNGIELLEFVRVKAQNFKFVNFLNFTLHSPIENR